MPLFLVRYSSFTPGSPMKAFFCIFMFLFLCASIFASEEDLDPIVVRLATESSLSPLYLTPTVNEGSNFPEDYLRQLNKVLEFDLSHNGSTTVVKRNSTIDKIVNLNDWKSHNVSYVIKGSAKGVGLSLSIQTVKNGNLKSTEPISLSGNISEDRRQIHKLSDSIHKALFGTDGIASTHIIYSVKLPSSDGKGTSEIWEMDYDGANTRQLTKGNGYCLSPAYLSPKPGFLTGGYMYVSYLIGQPKIYVTSFKDLKTQRLTFVRGNQLMPSMSRQRNNVAFISDITGNPDVFIQPFSPETGPLGKPYQAFSAKQATQGSPTFSPDGTQLAFVSDKDGPPRIFVIDVPTAGISLKEVKATLISKQNRENSAPSWSPDGTKLAYCSRTKGERQIWVYDFKTKQEKQLTHGSGNKENPSWAPNSIHLVFNTSETNASELYMVNLNQSEATQITSGKGEKRYPNWEPRNN